MNYVYSDKPRLKINDGSMAFDSKRAMMKPKIKVPPRLMMKAFFMPFV